MSEPFLGQITLFAGNFAPRGWALCNGQILSIQQNTALFAILGTTYGGNGQSTFGLPDLRGRAPIHAGQGPGTANIVLGEVGGNPSTTLTLSNMVPQSLNIPAATVSVAIPATTGTAELDTPSTGAVLAKSVDTTGSGPEIKIYTATATDTTLKPFNITVPGSTVQTTGSNLPFSNQSPYLGINFIIALEGVFPSRN
ncbi:phage tail protein [Pseudomonas soli]|jgi:microcystin-dependent protein|uniref:phage tail protein n=1 Tax=Pseudomonas soli TaxID=1306993 RepID=UPI0003C7C792|nr:tail fiber protein [Pseudomonas soli]AIN61815.1 tail protein [Pseudomonas soli]PYC39699.1 phage tail protein [Pseudomonas soli]